ncbi:formimidoylglutamase [Leptobacterium sp. I13]|uniref:formimidoylglutamase n=1 Tax=Leptobacterium meishanense TaxID=3128904 RepID=UPI0030ECAE93
MHQRLVIYTQKSVENLLQHRKGETKFGERIVLLNDKEPVEPQLLKSEAQYVLFGIPEDIGVVANHGNTGARHAWEATLKTLLNIQQNTYNKASKLLLLGHLDFEKEMKMLAEIKEPKAFIKTARNVTEKIDEEIVYLVQKIIRSGKKPIIVGGGHNNAYGIIKGCSLALNKPINAVNVDAHTDFRKKEGRHSGNGFSYAFHEGFLNNYFVFGLHENYTPKSIFKTFKEQKAKLQYNTFEELMIKQTKKIAAEINQVNIFIGNRAFGIEVDCDAIQNVPSSAMTPSGFSSNDVRKIVYAFSKNENAQYLHVCEAAPDPENIIEMTQVGKLISYIITDFIKKK